MTPPTLDGTEEPNKIGRPLDEKSLFLERLYKKYWGSLCSWLRIRYGNGPPDPEDLAQSAFEKVSHIKGFKEMENPRAYLFTVAARNALDELRGMSVRKKYLHQVIIQYGDDVSEITPERIHSSKEDMQALAQDMKTLSPEQREVVMRSRLLGQTYTQIRTETGWSTSAISRYMKEAMVVFIDKARAREKDMNIEIIENEPGYSHD